MALFCHIYSLTYKKKETLLMSERVERTKAARTKGAVYCTQKLHSPFHSPLQWKRLYSSWAIRETCTTYVHIQCTPIIQVPGSPGPRFQVIGSTEYSVLRLICSTYWPHEHKDELCLIYRPGFHIFCCSAIPTCHDIFNISLLLSISFLFYVPARNWDTCVPMQFVW